MRDILTYNEITLTLLLYGFLTVLEVIEKRIEFDCNILNLNKN